MLIFAMSEHCTEMEQKGLFVIVRLVVKMGQMSHDTTVHRSREEKHSESNFHPTI